MSAAAPPLVASALLGQWCPWLHWKWANWFLFVQQTPTHVCCRQQAIANSLECAPHVALRCAMTKLFDVEGTSSSRILNQSSRQRAMNPKPINYFDTAFEKNVLSDSILI